jgi:hypothetical protein
MTGDKAIRWSTIGAVAVVAIVAGWVSYRHALAVVSEHGETGWLGRAYPATIDGLIYSASMVLLNAARQRVRAHWLAYGGLGLGIVATLAANIAAGLAHGIVGAVVGAWPAVALVISYELLMIVVRTGAVTVAEPEFVTVPSDVTEAAIASMRATLAAGNPWSVNQIQGQFSLTRAQATKVRSAVLAEANGHAPEQAAITAGGDE